MDVIITRKFRLHWNLANPQNQIRLQTFYADYLAKANELIQYIFSLKPSFNLQSLSTFKNLFKNASKKAYNDLYTKSLDLKNYTQISQSGLRFKQRTMRMLCNDVY